MAKKAKRKATRGKRAPQRMSDRGRSVRKRTKRSKRGSRLGDVFTMQGIKRGLKSTGLGMVGGVAARIVDRVTGESEVAKVLVSGGIAVATGAMGWENISAGVAGGYAALGTQRLEENVLSDNWKDGEFANEDSMSDYPDAITDDGTNRALYLAEDGQLYLADDYEQDENGDIVLSDNATPYNSNLAMAYYN